MPESPYIDIAEERPRERQQAPSQVKLLYAGGSDPAIDFTFPMNPSSIKRSRRATYADIALAGYDAAPDSAGDPFHWTGAKMGAIDIEFLLYADGKGDAEGWIATIERMMLRYGSTGEPPDMLFIEGSKQDTVRVESVEWNPIRWTPELKRQMVEGHMMLKVFRPYKP